jgi:crotonobetainyl-CoA:carnitine CoA-transferase CaiB-like acyl-CoA transferase
MDDRGLLSGIRVIDCGTYVAGPASAMPAQVSRR